MLEKLTRPIAIIITVIIIAMLEAVLDMIFFSLGVKKGSR